MFFTALIQYTNDTGWSLIEMPALETVFTTSGRVLVSELPSVHSGLQSPGRTTFDQTRHAEQLVVDLRGLRSEETNP
jgi:hypothetical protein